MAKRRITSEVRGEIMRMAATSATQEEIAGVVGRSIGAVNYTLRPLGGVIRRESLRPPSGLRLTIEERRAMAWAWGWGLVAGYRPSSGQGAFHGVQGGERQRGRQCYQPHTAHGRAWERARRPKPLKLEAHPELWERVVGDLRKLWSPQQIVARLGAEVGGNTTQVQRA